MNSEFWSKPNKWPRDQEGFVFLARAAEEIGRKLFGLAWDAEIAGYDADLSSARAIGYTGPNSSLGMEAALERKARLAEATSRLQRVLDPVRAVIAASAAAGALVTALRPVPGGGLGEPLTANCWNTDDQRIATRFDFCRMSRETPFDNRAEGNGFIFIERKGLQTLLDALTPVDLPLYALSPDAQAAITAAKIEDLKEQLKRALVSRSTTRIVTAEPVTRVRGGRPSSIPIRPVANGPAAPDSPAIASEPAEPPVGEAELQPDEETDYFVEFPAVHEKRAIALIAALLRLDSELIRKEQRRR